MDQTGFIPSISLISVLYLFEEVTFKRLFDPSRVTLFTNAPVIIFGIWILPVPLMVIQRCIPPPAARTRHSAMQSGDAAVPLFRTASSVTDVSPLVRALFTDIAE